MDQAEYQRRLAQGYPESVARRIATGELPMDEASRMARAKQMRLTTPMFHASKQDIPEFKAGYSDRMIFLTPNPEFANSWLGKGKYQDRIGTEDEMRRLRAEERDLRRSFFDFDLLDSLPAGEEHNKAYDRMQAAFKAEMDKRGDSSKSYGTIYPLVTKADKVFDPTGVDGVGILPLFERLHGGELEDGTKRSILRGNYLHFERPEVSDWLDSSGYDGIMLRESDSGGLDTFATTKGENIRSTSAAFDPEYKGRNILGALGQGFGILGLLGLASAPREAQAQGLLEMLMPPTAEAFRAQGAGAGSDMPMTDEQYNEMVRMLNAR